MGLNFLGSVVRGVFATWVIIARRQSSGSLKRNVKHPGNYRGNVRIYLMIGKGQIVQNRPYWGAKGVNSSGTALLWGLRESRTRLFPCSLMGGQPCKFVCVVVTRGLQASSSRKNHRKVVLRGSAISCAGVGIKWDVGWFCWAGFLRYIIIQHHTLLRQQNPIQQQTQLYLISNRAHIYTWQQWFDI